MMMTRFAAILLILAGAAGCYAPRYGLLERDVARTNRLTVYRFAERCPDNATFAGRPVLVTHDPALVDAARRLVHDARQMPSVPSMGEPSHICPEIVVILGDEDAARDHSLAFAFDTIHGYVRMPGDGGYTGNVRASRVQEFAARVTEAASQAADAPGRR